MSVTAEHSLRYAHQPAECRAAQTPNLPVTVIEPRTGWQVVNLRELWRARELLYHLAWRDVKVRYKQTVLGAAWTFVQPAATMATFTLFLGRMAGLSAGVDNYPLFVLAGILPWTFFANAITSAGNSVLANSNLISKVYFPRLLIPFGSAAACLVDFAIALVLLIGLQVWYGVEGGWVVLWAPVIFGLLTAAAVGVGTMFAALTVAHRDFRFVLAFGVQMWMFATPSIYLPEAASPVAGQLLPLNPAYGLILNFRRAISGGTLDAYSLAVSGVVGLGLLAVGLLYFRRVERSFADVI